VLLVDDVSANLLALRAVLAPIGAELVEAESGPEALDLVGREWFAAVLIDVQMPGMDGFETAARIRATERGRDVPILFLTAIHLDERDVRKGYAAGAADYITKPFDPAVVRARVWAFVHLFRQRETLRRERLETALNFAPALVSIVTVPGYVCEFANARYRDAFKGRQVVGTPIAELGATADLIGLLDLVAVSGDTFSLTESTMKLPSGGTANEERIFDCTLQPLSDGRARVEAIVVFAIEVTDRVRSRRELEVARDAAEHAGRVRDDFLSIVSHELRTPLSSILGWAALARQRAAQVDVGRAFEVIERNARTQARLVDDILDVSRIIGGKLRLDIGPTDLGRAIAGAIDTLRPAADAQGLTLSVRMDELGTIEGDADRIQQVVWNLVSNAIKFTSRGGRVDVTASRRDPWAVIQVDDTGEGIEPVILPHLFQPFWQADASTTRRQGGLGLGLAIVSQIVRAHGGTITATSEGKGRGTSMVVELPVGSPAKVLGSRTRISRPAATPVVSVRLDDVRVLVVDDDEDARLLLNEIFAGRGAQVTCASSASEALDEVRRGHPHVVISDIGMQGVDGFALMRTIRRLPREEGGSTPAIALTALARTDDIDRALAAGYQLHASKPVDPMALLASVASLAGRSSPMPPA
jgi:signal transduction histidine kinase/ActR/RegA family two-component response regulator